MTSAEFSTSVSLGAAAVRVLGRAKELLRKSVAQRRRSAVRKN